MSFPDNHPWVEPLFGESGPWVSGSLSELASKARFAAGIVGYDTANARAHEITQYGGPIARSEQAQADFYQRLAAEGMMVMAQQQELAAHSAAAARARAIEGQRSTGIDAATFLLLMR